MTWIQTVSLMESPEVGQALQEQAKLYPKEYTLDGQKQMRVPELVANDSIVLSHSLIPNAMLHAFGTFGALMNPDLPLSRREQEMIATMVSVTNDCFY